MKSTWLKLFFCGILLIALLGCVRWAAAALRRSWRRTTPGYHRLESVQ